MNRALLIAGRMILIMIMVNACNNPASKEPEMSMYDSVTQTDPVPDSSNSEMKQVADSMLTNMHQQIQTGNNDIDYANMMLQHHQGAINMARLQETKGSNLVLKEFSRKIISDQQNEIAILAEFISRKQATDSLNNKLFKIKMDSSMQKMMNTPIAVYNDIDKDFVAQMIVHHQTAIDMAGIYLQYGTDAELRKLSEHILGLQTEEIKWLQEWIEKNG